MTQHPTRCPAPLIWLLATALTLAAFKAFSEAVPVRVETVDKASVVNEVPVTGTVTSPREALLSASLEGLVETVHVEIGDRVQAGDPVVTLDAELERLALQSAEAATLAAEERLADARRRYREAERLGHNQSISKSEIHTREAEVRIAEASLKRLKAEEARQRARVARYRVTAPFTGVISAKRTETGEWTTPGSALVELVDTDHLRIDFSVPQEHFPRLNRDTPVKIQLAATDQTSYQGRIKAIVPVSDPSARTFLVRALVDGPVRMTPGMSARATLDIGSGRQALVVSRDALTRYPNGRVTVWVMETVDGQPRVQERRVELGQSFANKVVVTHGLAAGDTVVVRGNNTLQEGQRVAIKQ